MNLACLGLEVIVLGVRLCFGEPAPRAGVTVCPAIIARSAAWQGELRTERLGAGSSPRTDEAISEWLSLRDQARVCRGN